MKGKDEAAQQRIEAAHSQLMMAGLSARLKVCPAAFINDEPWAGPNPPAAPRPCVACQPACAHRTHALARPGRRLVRSFLHVPTRAPATPPRARFPFPATPQGGATVEKEILYADRARYFPWRPRLWMAAYDILAYSAVAQARACCGRCAVAAVVAVLTYSAAAAVL